MSTSSKRSLTPQEYLEMERASEIRHEYYRGEMFAMSGASRKHNAICGNLHRHIHQQFDERPCQVFVNAMRVKVNASGLYTYPDISAYCGEGIFEDKTTDTLVNPQVIIEVLSPSTESYDRGVKFKHYQTVESLEEYILISQDRPQIEHFRKIDDQWVVMPRPSILESLDGTLEIQSIDCTLRLQDIYAKIEFDDGKESANSVSERRELAYATRRPWQ